MIRVMTRLRSRTEEWLVAAAVVAGTAVGLALAFVSHGTAPPIEKATPGTTSVTPKWLPAGTTLALTGTAQQAATVFYPWDPFAPQPAALEAQAAAVAKEAPPKGIGAGSVYSLAGKASGNPIPYYPYSLSQELLVTFLPGQYSPLTASSGQGSLVNKVTVGGFAGILTYPDPSLRPNGGSAQLEWVDPQGLHSISTERGYTSGGRSGLSNANLLKVANSLYG
jgi:hypothetical protein